MGALRVVARGLRIATVRWPGWGAGCGERTRRTKEKIDKAAFLSTSARHGRYHPETDRDG